MPLKRKTWIWIIASIAAVCALSVIAIAGFGYYFVSRHVKAGPSTATEAFRAFDEAKVRFKDAPPLFELDRNEKPKLVRPLEELPAGATRAEAMHILAWDPDKARLARVSLPFWMLKLGRKKIDLTSGGFDFQRLPLDIEELQRVGPVLLFDYRPPGGQRVLVWTQ